MKTQHDNIIIIHAKWQEYVIQTKRIFPTCVMTLLLVILTTVILYQTQTFIAYLCVALSLGLLLLVWLSYQRAKKDQHGNFLHYFLEVLDEIDENPEESRKKGYHQIFYNYQRFIGISPDLIVVKIFQLIRKKKLFNEYADENLEELAKKIHTVNQKMEEERIRVQTRTKQ